MILENVFPGIDLDVFFSFLLVPTKSNLSRMLEFTRPVYAPAHWSVRVDRFSVVLQRLHEWIFPGPRVVNMIDIENAVTFLFWLLVPSGIY